jgi:hypothetical protein
MHFSTLHDLYYIVPAIGQKISPVQSQTTRREAMSGEAVKQRIGAREQQIHNVKKHKPETTTTQTVEGEVKVKSFVCNKCNAASFSSRNELFRHVKICNLDTPPTDSITSGGGGNTEDSIANRFRSRFGDELLNRMAIAVVGGRLRGRTLQSAEVYSFKDNRWVLLPQMLDNRGSHGAAAFGDTIYAIAGGGMESNLCTCEKLRITVEHVAGSGLAIQASNKGEDDGSKSTSSSSDSKTSSSEESWKYISPMMTKRHALCVVSGGFNTNSPLIFALGGWYDGSKCSGELEVYDASTDSWSMRSPMLVPRRLLGACLIRNKLFAFGGMVDDKVRLH